MNAKIDRLLGKYRDIPGERFFGEAFIDQVYKEALGRKADVVVDVGALAGEFSAYIYDEAKQIYAIEMYSGAYKELTDNIKEFKLNKIKPFHLALAATNGETQIRVNQVERGGHRLEDGDMVETVRTITIDKFMDEQGIDHIDILKIDIEGIEEQIFRSQGFHNVRDKISFIIGEHGGTDALGDYGFKVQSRGPVWIAEK